MYHIGVWGRNLERIRPFAKLSDVDTLAILHSTDRGVDLAARYGVSPQTICDIRKGRRTVASS